MPDHVMVKFLGELTRRDEQRRKEQEETARDEGTTDVLELIDKSNLPPERKAEMLQAEIKHATKRLTELVARAKELEVHDGQ